MDVNYFIESKEIPADQTEKNTKKTRVVST